MDITFSNPLHMNKSYTISSNFYIFQTCKSINIGLKNIYHLLKKKVNHAFITNTL